LVFEYFNDNYPKGDPMGLVLEEQIAEFVNKKI
jgi:hypothetical protein